MTWVIITLFLLYWLFRGISALFRPEPKVESRDDRYQRYRERKEEERKRYEIQRAKEAENDAAETERLWTQHKDIIEKFLEITERKVSVIDDYGDESWSLLRKQIQECLIKIGERENIASKQIVEWTKRKWDFTTGREKQFNLIVERLEKQFREYHTAHRAILSTHATDFNNLSGQEFETYLMRFLPRLGFTDVRGTPATGDQGADIIASKDNRLFVIQAKRQSAPVGNRAVQEVAAALNYYAATEAWVITNSTFTPAAKALAQKNKVYLIDGSALELMILQFGG